jgi:integrase
LRSKEASLLDAQKAEKELYGWFEGTFKVEKGTKGGRKREVRLQGYDEREALSNAAKIQGNGRSIMQKNDTWQTWRENGLRKGRETLQEIGIKGFHEFRAAYATRRYEEIVRDREAPCISGAIFDKEEDMRARKIIAKELGHSRVDVVSAYIGGRSCIYILK